MKLQNYNYSKTVSNGKTQRGRYDPIFLLWNYVVGSLTMATRLQKLQLVEKRWLEVALDVQPKLRPDLLMTGSMSKTVIKQDAHIES